jgi:hypothetical protein
MFHRYNCKVFLFSTYQVQQVFFFVKITGKIIDNSYINFLFIVDIVSPLFFSLITMRNSVCIGNQCYIVQMHR